MPLTRESLERQLAQAEATLKTVAQNLKEKGVSDKDLKKQAKWKAADADRRAIKTRLMAVSAKEAIGADTGSEE